VNNAIKTIPMWDKRLPSIFDYNRYVSHPFNIDLKSFDFQNAWQHYENFGQAEGRICSSITDRRSFIELIPLNLPILEIGPFFSPAFKRPEANVSYLDCYSCEEMIKRAESMKDASIESIPEIDYVWSGQAYSELIDRKFSVVYSSHNIEHQHCLVTHLHSIESILEEDGAVFLVVPDKRYCFDHFFPETTLTDVVEAWVSKRKKHQIKDILDHHFYTAHNDAVRHWRGDHGANQNMSLLDDARSNLFLTELEMLSSTQEHIDVHAWKFTPKAFKIVFDNLFKLKMIRLRVERIYPTVKNSNEFYVVLVKG
jgi:predicted SAM-dependent methyltransferase